MLVGLPEKFTSRMLDRSCYFHLELTLPIVEGKGDGSRERQPDGCNLTGVSVVYGRDEISISAIAPFNDMGGFVDALCGLFDTKYLHRHFSRPPTAQEVYDGLDDNGWYDQIGAFDHDAIEKTIRQGVYDRLRDAGTPQRVALVISKTLDVSVTASWGLSDEFWEHEFEQDDWDAVAPLDEDVEFNNVT